jgi:hypothetical protein
MEGGQVTVRRNVESQSGLLVASPVHGSRDRMMSDVEADRGAAGDYPQNATGPLLGSPVRLILTNYARQNLSYVGERREDEGWERKEGSTRTDWLRSVCAIVWRVFHPFLPRLAGLPAFVTANKLGDILLHPCWYTWPFFVNLVEFTN